MDSDAEIHGAGLEGLVAQHLRAWAEYTDGRHELTYWHTRGGSEVDFIVYGEPGFYAIEVRHARQIGPSDLRGLKAFQFNQ